MKRVSSTASELNDFEEEVERRYNTFQESSCKSHQLGPCCWTYAPFIFYGLLTLLCGQLLHKMYELGFDIREFISSEVYTIEMPRKIGFRVWLEDLRHFLGLFGYWTGQSKPTFLVDFVCFEPPDAWKMSHEQLLDIMRNQNCFTEESIAFLARMLQHSGCGPSTAWPPGILKCMEKDQDSDRTAEAARKESEIVIYDVVLATKKTKTHLKDIDVLIIIAPCSAPHPR